MYSVTIDVDWASEEDISDVIDLLVKSEVKATWFITHDSKMVRRLGQYTNLFELGIHPNFDSDSTQGDTPKNVLSNLLDIVPGAISVRSHRLIQSYTLLALMVEEFHIKNDVSLFLPDSIGVIPHKLYFPGGQYIVRLPYIWEDDYEMIHPTPNYDLQDGKYSVPGLKIFNFHPIHISTDSRTRDFFIDLIQKLVGSNMYTVSECANYGW